MPRSSPAKSLRSLTTFSYGHAILIFGLLLMFTAGCLWLCYMKWSEARQSMPVPSALQTKIDSGRFDSITNPEWKMILTPAEYVVLREGGTEMPFTGSLLHEKRPGTYVTADCNMPVFRSDQKFDSGTGWPSFWAPISDDAIELKEDDSLGVKRVEVLEKKCHSHLGHVFDDGPPPTGQRYCINSVALKFIPD